MCNSPGLNGNPIPNQLPPELVPPSSRDLGHSVDFLKDLLRNDTTNRYTADPESSNNSYAKNRSLHSAGPNADARQDATVYKHDDSTAALQTYKSSSRHLDRKNVRARGDTSDASDLADIRNQLDNSQAMLDSSRDRDDADDQLAQEKDDLMYNIRRIQSDIEHNSRGRRTEAKESERRRLERELDKLKYEKLPDLERKIEDRQREKDRERRRTAHDRDSRNDRYSRFKSSDRKGGYSDGEEEQERGYMRGTFDSAQKQPDSGRSSPPPPPASSRSPETRAAPAPPPAAPSPRPAPAAPKPVMTEAERKEKVKAEAARRVQERLRALGIGGDEPPVVDSQVQERLEGDKKESAAKAASADHEAAERQKQRQLKLEKEKLKDGEKEAKEIQASGKAIAEMSNDITKSEMQNPNPTPAQEAATQGAREELDKEEAELLRREQELAEQKRKRMERIKQLEAEEAEEARRTEEEFKRKKEKFASPSSASKPPKPPAPVRPGRKGPPAVPGAEPEAQVSPPQPPPPPAPPAGPTPSSGSSTNPFFRNQQQQQSGQPQSNDAAKSSSSLGPNNPFNRNRQPPAQTASPSSVPARVATPPARVKTPVIPQHTEDWDIPIEKEPEDDSDSDSDTAGRANRRRLADQIFGGIMPTGGSTSPAISRPTSAQATSSAPPPPAPPAAPLRQAPHISRQDNEGSGDLPAPTALRGALLGQIQGGAKLRKAVTKDKSGPSVAGSVVGDSSAPDHIASNGSISSPRESPAVSPDTTTPDKRQSVDWYNGLASDATRGQPDSSFDRMPSHAEEDEDEFHEAPSFADKVADGVTSAASTVLSAIGLNSEDSGSEEVANVDMSRREFPSLCIISMR